MISYSDLTIVIRPVIKKRVIVNIVNNGQVVYESMLADTLYNFLGFNLFPGWFYPIFESSAVEAVEEDDSEDAGEGVRLL